MEYWLDADDRLDAVDQEFREFAIENGAPELASGAILGKPIRSFISDESAIEIWTLLLARAREGSRVSVPIRCDAPATRRRLRLDLSAGADRRVRVRSTTQSEEDRPPVPLLDAARPRGDRTLRCCSWCKRWRLPEGAWVEAEDLVAALHLFEQAVLPGVSHGICEECEASFRKGRG